MLISLAMAACVLSPSNTRLVHRALAGWQFTRTRELRLAEAPPPLILFADAECHHTLRVSPRGPFRLGRFRLRMTSRAHHGELALPNGARLPLAGMAFASLYSPADSAFFFAALPEVWAADPAYRDDSEDWEKFLLPVTIHELTHTRQMRAILPSIKAAAIALRLKAVDDDILQPRFGADSAFSRAVLAERDLLLAAASARTSNERLTLIRRALVSRADRHARFFTGADSGFAELETRFLDMEGVAQWASFRHELQFGPGRPTPPVAVDRIRGNRKWWSQEYGIALYLALDAVVPQWQTEVFPPRIASAFDLLTRATKGKTGLP
ncbi:MAG: hypothetical protein SFU84_15060 [Gemmatimonadales bacterium]|nr:hypothetical protein [Gemmatimonadales bacterium]